MFAGHFGVAAAVKSNTPEVPIWALLVSTQLYDIVFIPLQAAGIESLEGTGYGNAWIQAFYSHSLIGSLMLAIAVGLLGSWRWGRRGGLALALVTFSHWILDLIVHRPDLPVWPGNVGNLPLMGLGLWTYPTASLIVEVCLLTVGAVMYNRYTWRKNGPLHRARGIVAGAAMTVFLFGTLLVSLL
ncbi:hypothetical protein PA598K_01217 [Paenibacillus sp. 598K]|uniref:permease n=1 Tax=Paenibacillus sp. 598K TaxID=1117987 RepID=UPI000FFA8352|nr:permease [Paenibacillus sp. 598K]GBF72938.1 hypothetical protein PA598K_01217 [Paenibacillus sp. 598K]